MNPLPGIPLLPEYQSATIAIRPRQILVNHIPYRRVSAILDIINLPPSPNAPALVQLSAEISQALTWPKTTPTDRPPSKAQAIARRLTKCSCQLLAAAVPLWRPDWQAAAVATAVSRNDQSQLILWQLADPADHPFRANIAIAAQKGMLELMTGLPVRTALLHCPDSDQPTAQWVSPPPEATAAFIAALRLCQAFDQRQA